MSLDSRPKHKITVHNFGPLVEITDFEIRDLVCIIGEQSVGKSTLAKLIYYCRDIRNEFINLLDHSLALSFSSFDSFNQTLTRRLRSKFFNIYGLVDHFNPFCVNYYYNEQHSVSLIKQEVGGQLIIEFSTAMRAKMESVLDEASKMQAPSAVAVPRIPRYGDSGSQSQSKQQQSLKEYIADEIFCDDNHLIYVPAGRGLMSRRLFVGYLAQNTLSSASFGEREGFDVVDALTRSYFDYIRSIRDSWERLQASMTLMDPQQYREAFAMRDLLYSILKGEYSSVRGEEYVITPAGNSVPIAFTSSGQQELLWIANILLYLTFTGDKCFIVIEEPEAHLFSKGQSELINALAMFINITGSQLFLTTHSPYIIISLSNLLFAGTIEGDDVKEAVEALVPQVQHLKLQQTSGMLISEGKLVNILDSNVASIDVAKLDFVSEYLADIFEELMIISKERFRP